MALNFEFLKNWLSRPQQSQQLQSRTFSALTIDKELFLENLKLTQSYCENQLRNTDDIAKIFRTYNPVERGMPLFSYKPQAVPSSTGSHENHFSLVKWLSDPTEEKYTYLVKKLLEQQMSFKKEQAGIDQNKIYEGDVVITMIDNSVIDGASAATSHGLFDIYDMPAIDTWFYLTENIEGRLLFAWIPKELETYANDAIAVNCVDCIYWFKEKHPEEYKTIFAT